MASQVPRGSVQLVAADFILPPPPPPESPTAAAPLSTDIDTCAASLSALIGRVQNHGVADVRSNLVALAAVLRSSLDSVNTLLSTPTMPRPPPPRAQLLMDINSDISSKLRKSEVKTEPRNSSIQIAKLHADISQGLSNLKTVPKNASHEELGAKIAAKIDTMHARRPSVVQRELLMTQITRSADPDMLRQSFQLSLKSMMLASLHTNSPPAAK